MDTKIKSINIFSLKLARKLILDGQTVAFPTETVYGLGANAFCVEAVQKIFLAKGRPQDNPLIVHIADEGSIALVACDIGEDAKKLISAFMPGSITVVLNKKPVVPSCVTAGLDTVAVRMPQSKEARRFIAACGVPIAAPSANTSGRPSPTTAEEVFADLNGKIPLILKGKKCQVGIESTVVDCTTDTPVILRPGVITKSMIEQVLGKTIENLKSTTRKVNSPGVKYKHYAPNCPCILNTDGDREKIKYFYDTHVKSGFKPVVLIMDSDKENLFGLNALSIGKDEKEYAQNLYGSLRKIEKRYDFIIIVWTSKSEFAQSVLNRLSKVTGGVIL